MASATPDRPASDRLLDAAIDLFARQGYAATSVGDIEEAAGFTRRGGTLYRHFESKEAVLEAVLDRHRSSVADVGGLASLLPLPDRRSEVELLGKWLLAELDRQRAVTRVLEQDGDRLPELRDRLREEVSDPGYRWAAAYGESLTGEASAGWDMEALAVLLVGALVNYRRSTWTFGAAPLGVSEDRIVAAWTASVLRLSEPVDGP